MLDKINKAAKQVCSKTGKSISIMLHHGGMQKINVHIYPEGWYDTCCRYRQGTATPEDMESMLSVQHICDIPNNSAGHAELLEKLEAML